MEGLLLPQQLQKLNIRMIVLHYKAGGGFLRGYMSLFVSGCSRDSCPSWLLMTMGVQGSKYL